MKVYRIYLVNCGVIGGNSIPNDQYTLDLKYAKSCQSVFCTYETIDINKILKKAIKSDLNRLKEKNDKNN